MWKAWAFARSVRLAGFAAEACTGERNSPEVVLRTTMQAKEAYTTKFRPSSDGERASKMSTWIWFV